MSYAQWSSFAYYNVGDIVGYQAINYQALLANRNVVPTGLAPNWQLLTTPTPSAVNSLNTLTGPVVLASTNALFTPNPGTGVLDMVINFPVSPSGIYTELVGGSPTATITASCSPTSTIILTYTHAGGGGGSQYIKSITPISGSFTVVCNTNIDLNDTIHWLVL